MTGGDIFMIVGALAPVILIIGIIKVVSDNVTRRRAIEAGGSGEAIRELFRRHRLLEGQEALKFGLILASIGTALMIIEWTGMEVASAGALGLIFLFPGLALVAFHQFTRPGGGE